MTPAHEAIIYLDVVAAPDLNYTSENDKTSDLLIIFLETV